MNLKTTTRGHLVSTVTLPSALARCGLPFECMVFPANGPMLEAHVALHGNAWHAMLAHVALVRRINTDDTFNAELHAAHARWNASR